jgi:hypothetical protein
VTKTPKNRYGGSNTGSVGANAYVRNTGGNAHPGNASGNADALAGTNKHQHRPNTNSQYPNQQAVIAVHHFLNCEGVKLGTSLADELPCNVL